MKVKKLDEIKGFGFIFLLFFFKWNNHKSNIAKEASEIEKDETHPYFFIT